MPKAPKWGVEDQHGNLRALAEFQGRPVVLFFYPRASTSGCTIEVREFRDAHTKFEKRGVALVGASPDTVNAQKKFADAERLPFPLLADADRALCQRYGVLQEKSMYGRKFLGVVRTTFVISPQGAIAHTIAPVKPAGHAAQVLALLDTLGY